jgi:hypothetical protein
MTMYKNNGDQVPDHIHQMAAEVKAGKMDRREFMALASVFGASTAMAYGDWTEISNSMRQQLEPLVWYTTDSPSSPICSKAGK